MVYAICVKVEYAEKARVFLLENGLLNNHYRITVEGGIAYIPVKKNIKELVRGLEKLKIKYRLANKRCAREKGKETLDNIFSSFLSKREKRLVPASFEVIGDILILEMADDLIEKEKSIAEAFLRVNKAVKTVVKKSAIHSGIHRTRKFDILAGENKKETIHKESGLRFKVQIEKMYFSSKLGHERLRIAEQVKRGEDVLVMFSGCAPYCCVISRHSRCREVVGVEINPEAHKYALENVKLNRLNNIKLYKGDVKKILPKLKRKFDRIIMPLPKTGEQFLPLALKFIKKNGMIHYYAFLRKIEVLGCKKKIKDICIKSGTNCRIVRHVKAGQQAPYVFRVCFDVKV